MATYLDRQQIRHRRQIQRRFDDDQKRMATLITMILLSFARVDASGNRIIPTDQRTRLAIKAAIWAQVLKPYYIGGGAEPFSDAVPQSPFARLMREGIEGTIGIQVGRQISLLKRYIKDQTVLNWFLAPSTNAIELPATSKPNFQQPFYAHVDGNGYKLNDRIQRNAIEARAKIDRMIDYHIVAGVAVALIGAALSNYMTISGRSTGKPYGEYAVYALWRLLRIEMMTAAARATTLVTKLNPVADRIWWTLHPQHKEVDACDSNASGGPDGDGIYAADRVPTYPNHPGEACSLIAVAAKNMDVIKQRAYIKITNNDPIAQTWRGTMNEQSLIRALLLEAAREAA